MNTNQSLSLLVNNLNLNRFAYPELRPVLNELERAQSCPAGAGKLAALDNGRRLMVMISEISVSKCSSFRLKALDSLSEVIARLYICAACEEAARNN